MFHPDGFVLASLLALGGAGCMSARGKPGEEPVLYGLELQGVKALDRDDILEKLATQPSDRFAWQQARRLDPDALAVDGRRIEAYYRERGYYDARVVDVQTIAAGRGRARVVMKVSEGEPVEVTSLLVDGLDAAIDYPTVEFLGNTGSVALPITAALGFEPGFAGSGDHVALWGVGSGINVVALGVDWQTTLVDGSGPAGLPGATDSESAKHAPAPVCSLE